MIGRARSYFSGGRDFYFLALNFGALRRGAAQ